MQTLDLELSRGQRPRAIAYALLATAIAIAAEVGMRYRDLKHEIQTKQTRLATTASRTDMIPAVPRATTEEFQFARQTARRLSLPWDALFAALEDAASDDVALLGVEPDVANRTVVLSAEAKDYLAALSYVAALSERRTTFGSVRMLRHERRHGPQPRMLFTVVATWPPAQ